MSSHLRGSLLLVAAMACFSVSDALVQRAGAGLDAGQLAWLRYALLLLTAVPLALRQPGLLRSRRPLLQLGRAAGLVGSAVLFLEGIKTLPMAEATALVFASPLYVTLLSALLLREPWRPWRHAPVLLGFAGVLVVAQPGGAGFDAGMLFPLLSSLAWAGAVLCTRLLSGSDPAPTTILYSAALGVLALALPAARMAPGVFALQWPWLLAMAGSWCIAQWLIVWAYRTAPPSAIAPFSYSQLFWAALLGWLVFGQVPQGTTLLGIALIVLSGLWAAWMARLRTELAPGSARPGGQSMEPSAKSGPQHE